MRGKTSMKKLIRKQATRFIKLQDGFTLVELLVVVSIIVALTAVMVPQVAKFAERGSNGAAAAELETRSDRHGCQDDR
jgi:prepilin-type N-terminal cleavage/methylation domain-containing protein